MTTEEIKQKMREKKLTQAELARRYGVSQACIYYLINHRMNSARLVKRLARSLGVSVEQLTGVPREGKAA